MRGLALLALSPDRAVRELALTQLDAAAMACRRFMDDRDPTALHDFRVALRRLRSSLRAYAPYYDAVPKKLHKRLRRLARATNEARDTEVQVEWLRRQRRHLKAEARAGLAWLLARLQESKQNASRAVRKEVLNEFVTLEARLRTTLRARDDRCDALAGVTFARATGERLSVYCDEFATDLACIGSAADRDEIHAARIVGKRLRYLLEPLRGSVRGAASLVNMMKAMQDRLGGLNDRFVTAREIAQAVEIAGTQAEDVVPGLLELAKWVRLDTNRRYREIRARYLGRRARHLIEQMRALGAKLAAPSVVKDFKPRRLRLE